MTSASKKSTELVAVTGHVSGRAEFDVRDVKRRFKGTGDAKILALRFDRAMPHFEFGEPIRYIVSVRAEHAIKRLRVSMTLFSGDGSPIGSAFSPEIAGLDRGDDRDIAITLPSARLAPGSYFCGVAVGTGSNRSTYVDYDIVTDTLFFQVGPERTSVGSLVSWMGAWGSISFPELAIEPIRN